MSKSLYDRLVLFLRWTGLTKKDANKKCCINREVQKNINETAAKILNTAYGSLHQCDTCKLANLQGAMVMCPRAGFVPRNGIACVWFNDFKKTKDLPMWIRHEEFDVRVH